MAETIGEIVAWLRDPKIKNPMRKTWRDVLASRIEAAWKRQEQAYLDQIRDAVNMIGHEKYVAEHEQKPPVCNAAAMRNALVAIKGMFRDIDLRCDTMEGEAYRVATAALSAPARNCDVGTAEEQVARHHAYCYRMMKQNNHCCGPCPCYKFVNGEVQSCTLLWAQMPYEAEEGGAHE